MSSHGLYRSGFLGKRILLFFMICFMALMGCELQTGVDSSGQLSGAIAVTLDPHQPSQTQQTPIGPYRGMKAPFFVLSDIDGKEIRLSSLIGRPIYLNFWSASSPVCLPFLKDIRLLHNAYGDRLTVVSVNQGGIRDSVRRVAQDQGYEWWFLVDPYYSIKDMYDVRSMPTSIFINKNGFITERSARVLTPDELDRLARQTMGLNY